jgi:hypothetical protein
VVTANNQTKPYGTAFAFNGTEFTSSGLVNADTIGSATLVSAGAPAAAHVAGSPYPIVASILSCIIYIMYFNQRKNKKQKKIVKIVLN